MQMTFMYFLPAPITQNLCLSPYLLSFFSRIALMLAQTSLGD